MKTLTKVFKQLKSGDFTNFNSFYNETKAGVFFVIKKTTSNTMFIEDIMQETYVSFIKNISKIDENKNFTAYLLTIARNNTINYLKKNTKEIPIDDFSFLEASNANFDAPLLKYCKQKLTDEEWQILELCIINEYRRVEVAKILNKPIATVNFKYHAILKKIKTYYKEVYNET